MIVIASGFMSTIDASDWPQFQNDAQHSGIIKDSIPEHPSINWSEDVERIDATPIVTGTTVYVLAGNGTLYAFDLRKGVLLWRSQMNGWVFQTATPACCKDRIFAATDSGILSAFDSSTGEELWSRSLTDKRFESPITYLDGRIFLGEGSAYGAGEKRYLCFFENGTECWNHSSMTRGYQWCGSCAAGDYLIFGQNDGRLKCANRFTGALSDEMDLNDSSRISFFRAKPGRIRSSVTFHEDSIYTTSELDAQQGYAWKVGFDAKTGRFLDIGWSSAVGFSTSTPSVVGDRVYLGVGEHGHSGALVCLDENNGEQIWSYPVPSGVKSSPAISIASTEPRIVFSVSQVNGSLYCLKDRGDEAELLWMCNPPDDGYILGGAAISNGRIYFGTEGDQHYGKLYCLGEGTDEGSWPQFHNNPEHTGSAASRAPRTNQTAWVSEMIGAQPGSSPSVAEGRVYVNCINNLTAIDQNTGKALWSHQINSAGDYAFGSSPVYDSHFVLFSSDKTYCLNASDGRELWSFAPPSGRPAVDGSPAAAEGRVLVSDWDGHHYYCLDEETGLEEWNITVEGNAQSTPAVFRNKVVLAGWDWGQGGRIYCLHLENGTEIWNLSTSNSPCGSAALIEDRAFFATYNFQGTGDLLALSLENGTVLWKADVSPTDSTPAVADGRVFLCGGCDGFSDLQTYCFDAQTGDLIWKTPAEERIGDWRCSPAYADGMLYAGSPDYTEYAGVNALYADSGRTAWRYDQGGSSPSIAGGMLFTIGMGRVYAFSG